MADEYLVNKSDMDIVANAIIAKSGVAAPLTFPQGMADAVLAISGGGGLPDTISPGDTPVVSVTGYEEASSTTPREVYPLTVPKSGTYKVRYTAFDAPASTVSGIPGSGSHGAYQLYINHQAAPGTSRANTAPVGAGSIKTATMQLAKGDIVSLALTASSRSSWGGETLYPAGSFGIELCIDWTIF